MPDIEELSRLEKLAAEIEAQHATLGALIDDVAALTTAVQQLMLGMVAVRGTLARMDAGHPAIHLHNGSRKSRAAG